MFKRLIEKALSRSDPISPDSPFCVIGDIHGCFDLFCQVLQRHKADYPVICVGDYVDRGDYSAEVLRFLLAHPEITCLKGNHEAMLLSFLQDPQVEGRRWLQHGGLQTLASFGVTGIVPTSLGRELDAACNALKAAMGTDLISWLQDLPLSWQSGNIFVSHAGCNPYAPLAEQTEKDLLWGHPDFHRVRRSDGTWILHGHWIVRRPLTTAGRIEIDTGAYATGRLTAARVHAGKVEFSTT